MKYDFSKANKEAKKQTSIRTNIQQTKKTKNKRTQDKQTHTHTNKQTTDRQKNIHTIQMNKPHTYNTNEQTTYIHYK